MKNILIPTDLSNCTRSSLKYAIRFATISKTTLYFYHISIKSEKEIFPSFKEYVGNILKEKQVNPKDINIEYIVEKGIFSNQSIKKNIKKFSIDLVIMGASLDSFRNTFFGSLVSDLINEVNCPVLSIPQVPYKKFKIERIGFASELFDLKKRIKSIIPLAQLFQAEIDVFHVYPVFPEYVDIVKYKKEKILEKIKQEFQYEHISIHLIKTSFDNETIKGIKKYIDDRQPDMLVVSHKPRGLFDKLTLDSGITTALVKNSPVPVLAFNKKATKHFG